MQPNYNYYPNRLLQQGGNNQNRVNPDFYYQQYGNYVDEKTCSYKFLKAFSYLPCLPSSWSNSTRGAIGFSIFLFFICAAAVALGLIPVYLTIGSNETKNEFSIDVANGLKLQNQNLVNILSSTVESNRTLEQNVTLTNDINSLTSQLSAKFRSLNPNFEKVYNIRLNANPDQTIDVSYSLKTKPLVKSEIADIKDKIGSLVKNSSNFNQFVLANSSVALNSNTNDIQITDPILGEFPSKTNFLLSKSKDTSLQGDLSSKGKFHDTSEEQNIIQLHSKIKFLKDDDAYIKKYPIYFPSYEPIYPEYPPTQYTEPYYPDKNGYQDEKYPPTYHKDSNPAPYPTTYPTPYHEEKHPKLHETEKKKPVPNKLTEEKKSDTVKKTPVKDEKKTSLKGDVKSSVEKKTTEKPVDLKKEDEDSGFDLSFEESIEVTTKKPKKKNKTVKTTKKTVKLKDEKKTDETGTKKKLKASNKEEVKIESTTAKTNEAEKTVETQTTEKTKLEISNEKKDEVKKEETKNTESITEKTKTTTTTKEDAKN